MNMHHTEWTAGIVALFHRFEVRAFAWDTQEVRQLRAMLDMGIDAVYCDRLDRMVATVARMDEQRPDRSSSDMKPSCRGARCAGRRGRRSTTR